MQQAKRKISTHILIYLNYLKAEQFINIHVQKINSPHTSIDRSSPPIAIYNVVYFRLLTLFMKIQSKDHDEARMFRSCHISITTATMVIRSKQSIQWVNGDRRATYLGLDRHSYTVHRKAFYSIFLYSAYTS